MSNLIRPLSVVDTVLDIQDSINFAVFKSGQNITSQRYQANSSSSTSHIYAIQVPSTSTIVSRNVNWGSDITFTFTGSVAQYEYLWNSLGINQENDGIAVSGVDCFAPFPLTQLVNNMTCQINNTSVVQNNVQQILDPILRGLKQSELEKWYGSTLTQLDYWGSYENALPVQNIDANALAAPVQQVPFLPTWNSPFNAGLEQNCDAYSSRASFEILSVVGNTPVAAGANANRVVQVTIRVVEPLFLSPFIFNGNYDSTGIVGITQLNFTMSMDAAAKRACRFLVSQTAGSTKTVTNVQYTNPYMEFLYYTPPPTMLIPAVCATPLQQFVNYVVPNNGNTLANGASQSFTSNSLQLNSIPDKVIVWIDDLYKQEAGSNSIPDHYATISNVNILFNNQTGILSTFSPKQLYDASLRSGSQQHFDEFSGVVHIGGGVNAGGDETANAGTCGSVLYLNFGEIININEVYNVAGSLTTTQFQIQVTATNNTELTIKPQLNVMFLYSGVLTTTNGNSSSYLNGILTRNDVLNSASAPSMTKSELVRYTGGGILSDLKAMASNVLPAAKKILGSFDNQYAKTGVKVLDSLGYGDVAAGAMAAGTMGGAMAMGRMSSKMRK